jgi:hypothetical protein
LPARRLIHSDEAISTTHVGLAMQGRTTVIGSKTALANVCFVPALDRWGYFYALFISTFHGPTAFVCLVASPTFRSATRILDASHASALALLRIRAKITSFLFQAINRACWVGTLKSPPITVQVTTALVVETIAVIAS